MRIFRYAQPSWAPRYLLYAYRHSTIDFDGLEITMAPCATPPDFTYCLRDIAGLTLHSFMFTIYFDKLPAWPARIFLRISLIAHIDDTDFAAARLSWLPRRALRTDDDALFTFHSPTLTYWLRRMIGRLASNLADAYVAPVGYLYSHLPRWRRLATAFRSATPHAAAAEEIFAERVKIIFRYHLRVIIL